MDATRTEKSVGLGVPCGEKKCWCPLSENMTLLGLDSMDICYLESSATSFIFFIFVYPKINTLSPKELF